MPHQLIAPLAVSVPPLRRLCRAEPRNSSSSTVGADRWAAGQLGSPSWRSTTQTSEQPSGDSPRLAQLRPARRDRSMGMAYPAGISAVEVQLHLDKAPRPGLDPHRRRPAERAGVVHGRLGADPHTASLGARSMRMAEGDPAHLASFASGPSAGVHDLHDGRLSPTGHGPACDIDTSAVPAVEPSISVVPASTTGADAWAQTGPNEHRF